jgi:hypothetical protein
MEDALDPSIDRANERTGKWSEDEDIKLKEAVETHGGKNWDAITALVPGRTMIQCSRRWHNVLNSNIDPTTTLAGSWTADEDKKLKDAVQLHGGKGWVTIPALVPGRTMFSVVADGIMSWIAISTRRRHGRVDGRQMKTRS